VRCWNTAFAYLDRARGREPDHRGRRARGSGAVRGRSAVGVATSAATCMPTTSLAAGAYGSLNPCCAAMPRAARAADRGGADRSRRGRFRLRGDRSPAARRRSSSAPGRSTWRR
jgi:hypothetical protein